MKHVKLFVILRINFLRFDITNTRQLLFVDRVFVTHDPAEELVFMKDKDNEFFIVVNVIITRRSSDMDVEKVVVVGLRHWVSQDH